MRDPRHNPNFVKWFKGSKVVNQDGSPMVMYHGTTGDVESFDPERIKANETDAPFNGFWFSSSRDTSPAFRDPTNIMPVYLRITNPAPWQVWRKVASETQQDFYDSKELPSRSRTTFDEVRYRLIDMGYDGIIFDQKPDLDIDAYHRDGRLDYRTVRGGKAWIQKDKTPELAMQKVKSQKEEIEGELIKPDGSREPLRISIENLAPIIFKDHEIKAGLDISDFNFDTMTGTIILSNGNKIVSKKVIKDYEYNAWRPTGKDVEEVGYYTPGIGHVTSYASLEDFISSHSEDVWVCFSPTQIKSIYNKGSWDGRNPKINEQLREWIDLIEKVIEVPSPWKGRLDVNVVMNPNQQQILNLAAHQDLRGLVDGKDIYVWPALEAIHGEVRDYLGLTDYAPFYIASPNRTPESVHDIAEWINSGILYSEINGIKVYVDKWCAYKFHESKNFNRVMKARD